MTPSPSGLSVVRSVRLVNPNSNAAATERMVAAARAVAPRWLSIVGETTVASPSLIVDAAGAEMAEAAVVDAARRHPGHGDGVILSEARHMVLKSMTHGFEATQF